MPQMAPLMWISLFSMFMMLMFLTSAKILFVKNPVNMTNQEGGQVLQMKYVKSNWKW